MFPALGYYQQMLRGISLGKPLCLPVWEMLWRTWSEVELLGYMPFTLAPLLTLPLGQGFLGPHISTNTCSLDGYKVELRTSPAVQWLGLCASTAGCSRSIPNSGTRILHTMKIGQKNKINWSSLSPTSLCLTCLSLLHVLEKEWMRSPRCHVFCYLWR